MIFKMKQTVVCSGFVVVSIFVILNSAEAQIIQPNSHKPKLPDLGGKVSVNLFNLKETERIRNEIKAAVKEDKYFVQSQHHANEGVDAIFENGTIYKGNATHDPILIQQNNSTDTKINTTINEKTVKQEESPALLDESGNATNSVPFKNNATISKSSTNEPEIKNKSAPEKGPAADNETSATPEEEKKAPESDDPKLEKGGLIVQPEWTNNNPDKKSSSTVKVTEKNLEEAAEIRQEIQSAVAGHSQAVNSPGSDKVVKEVDEYFQHKFRLRSFLTDLLGSEAEDVSYDEANIINDHYEKHPMKPPPNGEVVPNVVDSIAVKDAENSKEDALISILNLSTLESRLGSSEILNLTSIEENLEFNFTEPVSRWKVIEHLGRTLLVGIMENSLVLLSRSNERLEHFKTIDFNEEIVDFDMFLYWNKTEGSTAEMIVVASKESIVVINAISQKQIVKWIVGGEITGLKYLKTPPNDHHLAILTKPPNGLGMPKINIYQFTPETNNIWMSQAIPLADACSEVVFMDTGRDIVLAVPQENATIIFSYNPEIHEHTRFESITRVESEGVKSISGFQMGGFSYLAISGYRPQILRYRRGRFIPQTIFGQSFQFVERFLPVPARTYRDDLILLVQHTIFYDTHTLPVVEALIWDGKSFRSSSAAPCLIGTENVGFGASCLIDPDRDEGIKGAAVISASGDISVLIPRMQGPSGLFTVRMGLIEKNLERELEAIFKNLKEAFEDQIAVILLAQEYTNFSEDSLVFDHLKTPEFNFEGDIEEIYINDHLIGEEDEQVNIEALLDLLNATKTEIRRLEELVSEKPTTRSKRDLTSVEVDDLTHETLTVDQAQVEELFVENINGVPIEEIFFIKNDAFSFPGIVEIRGNLEVQDETRSFLENVLEPENVNIEGNLNFDRINGIPWNDFISGLVLSNIRDEIENLVVEGNVFVENGLSIGTLNDLSFPNDFLLSSGPERSVILGTKIFHGILAASALEVEKDINGVNLKDVITLSDDQIIPGTTVFKDLEVTEVLEINGKISGEGFENFVPNTNLLESHFITSNCEFSHLEINGPIIVSGMLNNQNFEQLLNDIVYETDENVAISSQKTFSTITFTENVEIEDNALSGIPIDTFVTKDTEQELQISKISGNVFFTSLELEGLFDSVNITELDANSIKTYESHSDIELIFEEGSSIEATSLEILENLNSNSIDNYQTIFEDLEFDTVQINSFSAINFISDCPLQGINFINQMNLSEFLENRMSLTQNQNISGNFEVTELIVESDTFIESLNGLSTNFVLWFTQQFTNLPEMIQAGEIKIKNLHVTGSVTTTTLNGINFNEEIQDRVIWLNRPNFIRTPLRFLDPVVVDGPLLVKGYLNDELLQDLLDDLVFKTNDEITLTGTKRFLDIVNVLGNTTISQINGIPMSNIVTKFSPIEFDGSVVISGNLFTENLEVQQNINEDEIDDLLDFVRFDEDLNNLVFLKTTVFGGYPLVEDLYIEGSLNDQYNLSAFFNNLVYKNKPAVITGRKLFTDSVTFQNKTHIGCLNGINATEILDNVVVRDGLNAAAIDSPVTFLEPVEATSVTVQEMLETTNLGGCDIYEWVDNSIRTDLPADIKGIIHFASGALDGNSVNVLKLNGLDTKDMITLHTPQNLSGNYKFSRVFLAGPLETAGFINGVDLAWEMQNTLMVDGDQHIKAPTAMRSVIVQSDLEIVPLVNNKDLNNLATINGPTLELESPVAFKSVTAKKIYTEDLVSSINVSTWYHNSLWNTNREKQTVFGKWSCDHVTIAQSLEGNGEINGVPIDQITSQLDENYPEALKYFEEIEEYQRKICFKTLDIVKRTHKQIYFLKYFDNSFKVFEDSPINRVIFFKVGMSTYLLVNVYCYSTIYLWNGEYFEKITGMDSGSIQEVLAIPKSGEKGTYIVINSRKNNNYDCSISGINIWFLESKSRDLEYLGNFGFSGYYSMIHHSPDYPGRFYGIDEKSNLVIEVDIESDRNKTWNLPFEQNSIGYRFLPHGSDLGIALSDGQRLLVIEKQKSGRSRRRRFLTEKEDRYSAPNTENKFAEDSTFAKKESHRHSDRGNGVINDLVNVLGDLVNDLDEEVSSTRNNSISNEELRNLLSNYSAILAGRGVNTSDIFEDINTGNNLTNSMNASDKKALNIAKILHYALKNFNSMYHNFSSETVGFPLAENRGVLDFEDIRSLLRNGFTNMINIFLVRRETLLGETRGSENKTTLNQSGVVNSVIEDLRGKVETLKSTLAKNEAKPNITKSMQDQVNINIRNEAEKKFAKLTDEDMKDLENNQQSSNSTVEGSKVDLEDGAQKTVPMRNNSSNLVNEVKAYLLKLIENLSKEEISEDYSEKEPDGEDYKFVIGKFKEALEEMAKRNSSFKKIINESITVVPSKLKDHKADIILAEKLLAAWDQTKQFKKIAEQNSRSNHSAEEVGIIFEGQFGSVGLEGVLNILSNGFYTVFNHFLERRDNMLGTAPNSELEQPLKWTSELIIGDLKRELQKLEDRLKEAEDDFKRRDKIEGLQESEEYFVPTTPLPYDQQSGTIKSPTNSENLSTETVIAHEIRKSLLVAYNHWIPGRSTGEEILALKVGSPQNRRTLIAVTNFKEHQIPGQHDAVKLYFDIEQGRLFQTLSAFRPRSLTALHLGDETVLAFVEDKHLIRIFIYRGVQGFVEFTTIRLEQSITILTSASLPGEGHCLRHFLVAIVDNEIIFYEAKMAGRCGISVNFSCDKYTNYFLGRRFSHFVN